MYGGLPPALLAETKTPSLFREWMDSFFARDIQRLFAFRDINRFNALFEYVLRQSGGPLDRTRAAAALGISRPTVESHLQAHLPDLPIRSWRNKAGREVDFVLVHPRDQVDAIECKWNPADFDPAALEIFRSHYPKGKNYLVTPHDSPAYARRFCRVQVTVCNPEGIRGDSAF